MASNKTKKKLLERIQFTVEHFDPVDTHVDQHFDRNRIETRTVRVYEPFRIDNWPGLMRVISVYREVGFKGTTKTRTETAFFISSHAKDAAYFQRAIRGHWSIENTLHYVKDVTFGEDASKIRSGHAPVNFSVLRSVAMTLFRRAGYSNMKQAIRRLGFKIDMLYQLLA